MAPGGRKVRMPFCFALWFSFRANSGTFLKWSICMSSNTELLLEGEPTGWNNARRVRNVLWAMPFLRGVEVSEDSGRLVLHGTLSSFYHKQLCLSGAQRVAGVRGVVDHIDVVYDA